MTPGDFPSDCVNFRAAIRPSINFCEVSLRQRDFPQNSINFPCSREIFCQLPSIFCAAGNSSVIFRELCVRPVDAASISVLPVDLPSTSINFRVLGDFLLTSVNSPCNGRIFVNFHQFSVRREIFRQLTSTSVRPEDYQSRFLETGRPSVNYR